MKRLGSLIKRQGRLFYSFLFSYIFVLLIPLLFGAVIYRSSFSAARSETQSAFMGALDQTRAVVDGRINEIRKYAATFRVNEHVQSNMYIIGKPTPLQRYGFSDLQKELFTFKLSNPLIKEIDIYFPNGDFVLGTRSRYKSDELADMAQTYYHMDSEEWKELSSGAFYQKYEIIGNGRGGDDILYVLSLDTSPSDRHSAVLLITINGAGLLSTLADRSHMDAGDLYLSWENGDIVDSRFEPAPKGVSASIGYPAINGKKSVFSDKIDGGSVSILHVPSSAAGFEYVLVVKLTTLYQKATGILYTICAYIMICLVIGIAVSLKFSKRSYGPIDRIIRMISTAKGNSLEINKFSSLEKSLGSLFQRQELLEDTLKKQRNDIRNAFLTKLAKGELAYSERNFAEAVTLDIILDKDDFYCISIFTITDYGSGFAPSGEADGKSIELAEYSVENIIDELVSAKHKCYVFTCDGSVICLAASKSPDNFENNLISSAATATDFFSEKLLVTVAAAVSHVSAGYGSIPNLYLEASNSLEYKLLFDTPDKVVPASQFLSAKSESTVSVNLFQVFAASMLNGNSEGTHSALISMADAAERYQPKTSKVIKARIKSITDLAFTALARFGSAMPENDLKELYERILAAKSFDELRERITLAFDLIQRGNSASSKNTVSIDLVTEYIRKNCFDPNFSLTSLADHFKVNSSYLSRKFKGYVGVGISEYIQLLRFEQAKELLRDTDKSIPSIAAIVGYYSAQTFSNSFKKATGMSPSRYKASVLETKSSQ
jgi:AraC-like DNA-binding protein